MAVVGSLYQSPWLQGPQIIGLVYSNRHEFPPIKWIVSSTIRWLVVVASQALQLVRVIDDFCPAEVFTARSRTMSGLTYSYLMYMSILPSCVSVHHMYAWQQQRPEKGVVISDVQAFPCWYWKLDLASPQEKQVFLISPGPVLKYTTKTKQKMKVK